MKEVHSYSGITFECWTMKIDERRYRWAYSISNRPPVQMEGPDSTVEVLALKEGKYAAMRQIDRELGRDFSSKD